MPFWIFNEGKPHAMFGYVLHRHGDLPLTGYNHIERGVEIINLKSHNDLAGLGCISMQILH